MGTTIDWPGLTDTLNPLGWGCYGPGGTKENKKICSYCYACEQALNGRFKSNCEKCNAFEPHYHLDRLKGFTGKKPKKIFIQSMGDLFGDWVEESAIQRVIDFCNDRPQHEFMFLTKNPKRYAEFEFPGNCWLGATVTNRSQLSKMYYNLKCKLHFLSIEPLSGDFRGIEFPGWRLIIVGAMTGKNPVIPRREWVESIKHPNIYYKESITKLYPEFNNAPQA